MDQQIDTSTTEQEVELGERRLCDSCSWAQKIGCCKAGTHCTRESRADWEVVGEWLSRWRSPAHCLVGALILGICVREDPPDHADDCPGWAPRVL